MAEDRLKKFGDIKASEVMVKDPLYIAPDDKISMTELLMLKKKIGGLPVIHGNNKIIGIITQRDIRLARFAMSLDSPNTIVRDLMTPEPIVVREDSTIKEMLKLMFDHKIERLPVVNSNNELLGLILQQEILKKLYDYLKG